MRPVWRGFEQDPYIRSPLHGHRRHMACIELRGDVQGCISDCAFCQKLAQRIGMPAYNAVAQTAALCLGWTDAQAAQGAMAALRDLAGQPCVVAFPDVWGEAAYQQCAACQGSLACFAFEVILAF